MNYNTNTKNTLRDKEDNFMPLRFSVYLSFACTRKDCKNELKDFLDIVA